VCLVAEVPSVCVPMSDESVLMEKLECFTTLARGRGGLLFKRSLSLSVSVCQTCPGLTSGNFLCTCKAELRDLLVRRS
jgi:hypothetical protein